MSTDSRAMPQQHKQHLSKKERAMVDDIRTRRLAAARKKHPASLTPLPALASREPESPVGVSGLMWRRDPLGATSGSVLRVERREQSKGEGWIANLSDFARCRSCCDNEFRVVNLKRKTRETTACTNAKRQRYA